MGKSTNRPKTSGGGLRVLLMLVSALTVAGCFGDPSPDPESAPLEVVMDGCKLNRSDVAAGTHEVSVLGAGVVEISDASGRVVLSVSSEENGQGQLQTTAQSYTVRCTTSSGVESSAELDSVPAGE